ncbi:hypothetical protein [Cellulomonas dongxiuzhuiae]|uniref:Uncharacterized protein n=1 Tax=Cellulomonas dongxiuzhuiae TaxID=2819979 RepID=A0ABX8GIF2_9CELL|nr:hypothetical protein [Cellulomonas dongxiuzhuiae]MBO3094969.1 hypothetical protein [Cellulomonas dongxiuzhuiae]QWC15987.1 hypothetical protein KKR89_17380 [Cellulomonas dongxiuzhuiae]
MSARLSMVAPDLVEILRGTSPSRLHAVAQGISEWIVEDVGLADPRVDAALAAARARQAEPSSRRDALTALVDELDARAWDVLDQVEAGQVPQQAYLDAFSLARAASAVRYARESDGLGAVLDVVYEAQAARGDLVGVRRRVMALLG